MQRDLATLLRRVRLRRILRIRVQRDLPALLRRGRLCLCRPRLERTGRRCPSRVMRELDDCRSRPPWRSNGGRGSDTLERNSGQHRGPRRRRHGCRAGTAIRRGLSKLRLAQFLLGVEIAQAARVVESQRLIPPGLERAQLFSDLGMDPARRARLAQQLRRAINARLVLFSEREQIVTPRAAQVTKLLRQALPTPGHPIELAGDVEGARAEIEVVQSQVDVLDEVRRSAVLQQRTSTPLKRKQQRASRFAPAAQRSVEAGAIFAELLQLAIEVGGSKRRLRHLTVE